MITLSWASMCAVTDLQVSDIRFVLHTLLNRSITGPRVLNTGESLALAIYDLLKQMKFNAEDTSTLIKTYAKNIFDIGKLIDVSYAESVTDVKHKIPMSILSVLDNRYATWDAGKPFDLKEMVWLEQLPVPVLSLSIVIPRLCQRVLKAGLSLRDRHVRVEEQTVPETICKADCEHKGQQPLASSLESPKTT